jgi:hypothetical protein
MSDTMKRWCNDCDELHRVPAHLVNHSVCCVDCGGTLREAFAKREVCKARKAQATRKATPEPEPVVAGDGTKAWLKRSAPFMIATALLACTALVKLSAGHTLPALASSMLCLVTCLRVFLIYREEVLNEEGGFMTGLV